MPQQKRILVFHPTIAPYRIDFFNRLAERFETKICLQYWNLNDQQFDYQKIYDQFLFVPTYLSGRSTISLCRSVTEQIRVFNPDVVLTNEYGLITLIAILLRAISRKRYRIVVISDDSYYMITKRKDFSIKHRIARQLLAGRVDDVIVVEPRVEQWYQKKYKKGIFFPIIADESKARSKYERALSLSMDLAERYNLSGKSILLSVNRLVGLKNLHRVIDAFAQSKTDAVWVIVGDGPERTELERHAEQVDKKILFIGHIEGEELYAWYNLASVFILASYLELFGAVTNEALLAGCRVIISEIAGSSCLVNEKNGETIDPFNLNAITAAIDRQLSLSHIPDLSSLRDNLMGESFEKLFRHLANRLNSLE